MTNTIAKRQNGTSDLNLGSVVDNIFQNSLRRFFDGNFWDAGTSPAMATVPVNVRETEQHYELDVIAPGCRKEDFRVHVENSLLTISFEQKKEKNEQDEKAGWVRNEFVQRSFSRSFTLDETVDLNNIKASYTDGILKLVLPKNEKAKKLSRSIEVK